MRLATSAVFAALALLPDQAFAGPPWPNEYVLSNEIRETVDDSTYGWVPPNLEIYTSRIMIDLSTRKTRAEYRSMMAENPNAFSVNLHQVVGLTLIWGREKGDHPCRLGVEAHDLDGNRVFEGSSDGTNCALPPGKKSTPTLQEDEFITGIRVCQSRRASSSADNFRLKGVELKVARLGADGLEDERAIAGYERTNCPNDGSGWQEKFYQCGRNEIVVGLDIVRSWADRKKPDDIHLLLPICAPVISKADLTAPQKGPLRAPELGAGPQ